MDSKEYEKFSKKVHTLCMDLLDGILKEMAEEFDVSRGEVADGITAFFRELDINDRAWRSRELVERRVKRELRKHGVLLTLCPRKDGEGLEFIAVDYACAFRVGPDLFARCSPDLLAEKVALTILEGVDRRIGGIITCKTCGGSNTCPGFGDDKPRADCKICHGGKCITMGRCPKQHEGRKVAALLGATRRMPGGSGGRSR